MYMHVVHIQTDNLILASYWPWLNVIFIKKAITSTILITKAICYNSKNIKSYNGFTKSNIKGEK